MTDPTITCPKCGTEIKLTESLAAPLVESTRRDYEQKLAQQNTAIAEREKAIRSREEAVTRANETLEQRVADQLRQERTKIAAEESKKAKLAIANDLEQKAAENLALQQALQQNNAKLAEAQKAQAELLIKSRELDDARREMQLTIQTQVQQSLAAVREKARQEAEESLKLRDAEKDLRLAEKDLTLAAMQKQIDELKRRSEQGSQQLQGEALELQLESLLAGKFPHDRIEPVPKGEHGGDILHRVHSPAGISCGTILWESKRTKNWSDAWLPKLRDDQRAAKAEIAILITQALPKGIDTFDHIDGIWVADPRCLLPIALLLRASLLEVAAARQSAQGQQSKAELVYQYLTGPRFKLRVSAIVEKFDTMREDLNTERKTMTKLWAKREQQLLGVLESTAGLYGDLQGIAGKSLAEIDGLDIKLLESPAT